MQAVYKVTITPEEYLELEREAEEKSEYYRGQIFAMAGASEKHNRITVNTVISLGVQIKGRSCSLYSNDLRVKVSQTGLYTYPDAIVVCGPVQFDDTNRDTLLNPTVVIEVLSESTEAYDRGRKFDHYRTVDSLTDYLLLWQDDPTVEHFVRQTGGQWLLTATKGLDAVVTIDSIGCVLPLSEIYDKIEFSPEDRQSYLRRIKEPDVEYGGGPNLRRPVSSRNESIN